MMVHSIPALMLTRKQVGELLDVGLTTVDILLGSGEIPSVKIGGSRRVRLPDLVAYINSLKPDIPTATPITHKLSVVDGRVAVVPADGHDPSTGVELTGVAA